MKIRKAVVSLGLLITLIVLLKAIFFKLGPIKETGVEIFKHFKKFKYNISGDFNFAGEPVPLSDFKVRELLDQELDKITYSKTSSILLHKSSARWFKIIEPILEQYKIPNDFKFIALVESQLSNSVSKRGAAGFWQFMKHSARELNLIINDDIDERLNIEKSTVAACKFFKNAYQKTGSWTLAAAAFNMGLEGLLKKMKQQNSNNYYDLHLNPETERYIFKILAMKEVINNPSVYGYKINSKLLYPHIPTQKIKLPANSPFNLVEFARQKNIDPRIMKVFNPWILKNEIFVPDSISLYVEIPYSGLSRDFIDELVRQDSIIARRLSSFKDTSND